MGITLLPLDNTSFNVQASDGQMAISASTRGDIPHMNSVSKSPLGLEENLQMGN